MPDQPFTPPEEGDEPSFFTRLSISLCPQDDGTRPVNPAWSGADIGFLSPAISFSTFPLKVGEPVKIKVHVDNFGTMDAVGAYMELAYNLYLGLQAQGLVPIQNIPLPIIPAGKSYTAVVTWTPPDTSAIHACVHARVFDIYSLSQHAKRCYDWSPYVNPQAGARNTILIKIVDETKPVVVSFPVKNFYDGPIQFRLLISEINSRTRFDNPVARFPLPFILDRRTEADMVATMPAPGPAETTTVAFGRIRPATIATLEQPRFDAIGASILPVAHNGMWPRAEIDPEYVHDRFGFDITNSVRAPDVLREGGRYFFSEDIGVVEIKSLHSVRLDTQQEEQVTVVIPPEAFPERGRRKRFQIDLQIGGSRPTQQIIHLAH